MNNKTLRALYGVNSADVATITEATQEFEIKTQGRKFARLASGNITVEVPRAKYVKDLEDKVIELQADLRKQMGVSRKQQVAINGLIHDISALRKEMKTKMDRF
jgi:capsule polysaccharide export protein KpsE/RkpR